MKQAKTIRYLVLAIIVMAAIATAIGITSDGGPGPTPFRTVHGEEVMLYGKGLYKHMSAEVAPQGIAQDYVTLFAGLPLLFISLMLTRKGSLRGRFLLAGTSFYFLVTYLFYLCMGMYNPLFLVYIGLTGTSFFTLILTLLSFDRSALPVLFEQRAPLTWAGRFLIFGALCITLLWLSIIVPPLIDGSVFPSQLEHYTTLIVQGIDLALLLPMGFVCGLLLIQKSNWGYLLGPVFLIFQSLLFLALVAKIIAMGMLGYSIIPVVFIIPAFWALALYFTIQLLLNIRAKKPYEIP